MRIAIDGFELNKNYTGVGRYLFNLLKSILKFDIQNDYTIYLKESPFFKNEFKNLHIKVIPFKKSHTKWQNTILLRALNSGKFDLFWSPEHSLPLMYKGRSVLTIHDPSWRTQKSDYSLKERLVREIKTKISLKKTKLIFTVSKFTKSEILKYYSFKADNIIPIHSGVEDSFCRVDENTIDQFKEKYRLDGHKVIGFLGGMFKRRHLKEVINSFNLIENRKVKLILVGKDFSDLNLDRNKNQSIIWISRIAEEEINAFYSSIDLFLYLSEYEGFGFPPMEALLNHTVSLLLEGSSLSEVFKDIAHFTSDLEPRRLADRMINILEDPKGLNQKIIDLFFKEKRMYFNWDRAAKEYLKYLK